jgi:hypothetical protein
MFYIPSSKKKLMGKIPNIILVAGLPGSGKSHYTKRLPGNNLILDDFNVNNHIIDPSVDYSIYDNVIIIDPMLCAVNSTRAWEKLREWFGYFVVQHISFDNDPETCIKNIRSRNDGRQISDKFVMDLSACYEKTDWNKTIPCYGKGIC